MLKSISCSVPKLLQASVCESLVLKRFAGHSKWQNIRHIKGEKDAQRSILFTKIGRQMKVAMQEGGSTDPKFNTKLAQVIDQAKRSNMPVGTIQSIIKSSQNDKTKASIQVLDIRGPSGCFILCEVFSSQHHVLKQNIATILKKHKCKYGEGSGLHFFEEKGIIETEKPQSISGDLLEVATDHAIESGAEDVKLHEDNQLQFFCGSSNLNGVVAKLEELGYKVSSASVEYIPNQLVTLQDADLELCGKLYDKLEALPDVVRLADNIA